MSATFYTLPISNFAAKVEVALRLKGVVIEAVAPPGLGAWKTRAAAHPAWQSVLAAQLRATEAWLAGKI